MKVQQILQPFLSAVFWVISMVLGRFINFDQESKVGQFCNGIIRGMLLLWLYNIFVILGVLAANTVSVKHNMLSFKVNGSFIGQTLLLVFSFLLAALADYWYTGGEIPKIKPIIGCGLMIIGASIISNENHDKASKPIDSNKIPYQNQNDLSKPLFNEDKDPNDDFDNRILKRDSIVSAATITSKKSNNLQ